jgi:hypothetical protein
LYGISETEYVGVPDTRISVYGYAIFFCGAPIHWTSKEGRNDLLKQYIL